MKKRKDWVIMGALIFLCALLAGGNVSAAEEKAIVPTYIGMDGNADSASTYQYQRTANGGVLTIPVQVQQAGEVHLEIAVKTEAKVVNMVLSASSVATDSGKWLATYMGSSQQKELAAYIKNACTLYLYIFPETGDTDKEMAVTIRAYQREVTAQGSELKKGKWVSGYANSQVPVYYKVKVTSSGCLKFETSGNYSGGGTSITLLNSKKKEMKAGNSYEKITYYGVKKGTYYVKVEDSGTYKLRYAFEKIPMKNNTKKAKAVNLKSGKTEKGVFLLGDKNMERWYKVTLPKNKTIKLNIPLKSNYSHFGFTINQLNGKKIKAVKYGELKIGKNQAKVKLKKGTYYFVVDAAGTGSYSIQWK